MKYYYILLLLTVPFTLGLRSDYITLNADYFSGFNVCGKVFDKETGEVIDKVEVTFIDEGLSYVGSTFKEERFVGFNNEDGDINITFSQSWGKLYLYSDYGEIMHDNRVVTGTLGIRLSRGGYISQTFHFELSKLEYDKKSNTYVMPLGELYLAPVKPKMFILEAVFNFDVTGSVVDKATNQPIGAAAVCFLNTSETPDTSQVLHAGTIGISDDEGKLSFHYRNSWNVPVDYEKKNYIDVAENIVEKLTFELIIQCAGYKPRQFDFMIADIPYDNVKHVSTIVLNKIYLEPVN